MKHAWDNYATYAWGKNELRPISHKGHSASIFGSGNFGASIVDGLDTLYIMGFMDEFKRGRDWVEENLNLTGVVITHCYLYSCSHLIIFCICSSLIVIGVIRFRD